MLRIISFLLFLCILFEPLRSYATSKCPPEEDKSDSPPKIGNYVLSSSQQPGPLISFGQNILDEGKTKIFLFSDVLGGSQMHFIDAVPYGVYGITDDFCALLSIPVAVNYKQNKSHSSGLSDMFLQLEYAFYNQDTSQFGDRATLVANVAFPTGSATKQPPTGNGSSSFFLGSTFNRTYVNWFFFTSPGVLLTTSHKGQKVGNEYLYQVGFGRNFYTIDSEWIFAWLIETNGLYTEKTRFKGHTDPNSGGNLVVVTPSLWISSEQVTIQFGIGLPVAQRLFGNQTKNKYLLASNLSWLF
ncbi:MAG: hypothetical protein K2Y08_03015 [Alphaproteobacteria bacterium]|nr:hypothetical protein [Alphaproteobacteria bacterium]